MMAERRHAFPGPAVSPAGSQVIAIQDASDDVVGADLGAWQFPPPGVAADEVVKPIRDQIEVKSYVGGLVKSFERKAA